MNMFTDGNIDNSIDVSEDLLDEMMKKEFEKTSGSKRAAKNALLKFINHHSHFLDSHHHLILPHIHIKMLFFLLDIDFMKLVTSLQKFMV